MISPDFHKAFTIARLPRMVFGAGKLDDLPSLIQEFGNKALLVTGSHSFLNSNHWSRLQAQLAQADIDWQHCTVQDEPSPKLVDDLVKQFFNFAPSVVVAIGGGSVLDAAKAVAGLLIQGNSVMDHLEGVGKGIPYAGPSVPMIAVPTTAGTGSEATKNAVLSERGEQGFKKSFRHECLVPQVAVLDPDLLSNLPPKLMAAQGMDALTQLIEAYVSTGANPFTDALALSGIQAVRDGLFAACEGEGESAAHGRASMLYAALISGICLAQTGLGSVHGLASPLGAYYPIPHGVVCGTLLAAATRVNISVMQARDPNNIALAKYAVVAKVLSPDLPEMPPAEKLEHLITALEHWQDRLAMPRLSTYGIPSQDFAKIAANSRGGSMKTNPIELTDEELVLVLAERA